MFEARNSRWRLALLALLSLGFVSLGLWFVGAFGPDHPVGVKPTVAGWLAIGLFGACAVAALVRMRDTGVVMRVDDRGIWWKRMAAATIPWSEIEEAAVVTIHRQKMLGLAVRNPDKYRSKTIQGRLSAANRALVGYPLCLSVTGTDRTFAELLAAVSHHLGER